ncbi:bacteriocin cleavage/export ABC transporter [Lactococcus hodotermopsidis]|uniref:Bacteriocin cleavage/export ABC transporter n=1 Tax=Pseudolactococcus hodotermopsidis TaxID=2709157 RepID=A0A6A0BDG6_9LACT|nr:peptidase domain-containing ABC transporter [Lactococcus hodotermopsidis]GFH42401.1 bacteriocin cleavage/export ABC transporter [Lactococcus hodotermopsidis]
MFNFGKYPVVLQHDESDCAAAVMSMICKNYKQDYTIMKLREILGTDVVGTTVAGIVSGAEEMGFEAVAVRLQMSEVKNDFTLPAIAQVKTPDGNNHFVVINKISENQVIISDPAFGLRKMSKTGFQTIFQGVLVILAPKSDFETKRLKSTNMWGLFKQVMFPQKRILLTVIATSAILTLIGILSSLFSKVIFDEVIPYQLKQSLFLYFTVFAVIALVQLFLEFFRSYILLFLSRKIDLPVLLGYYNHVLKLPYQFFKTRRTGDILTRFQDAMTIKNIFSQVSISLVLDLFLACFTGVALAKLNSQLFIIIFVAILIDILLIYVFKGRYRALNYEQMAAGSALNSQLIESIQNIETVKSYTSERHHIENLEKKFVKTLKLNYAEGLTTLIQGTISSGLSKFLILILLTVGALAIINGQMSIGDLIVFQTLSTYFIGPVQNLVGLQLTFQEADIAIKRLNELMDLETENDEPSLLNDVNLAGDIQFHDVSVRYGSRAPVIEKFNLTIPHGKKIAIVGPSGAGKSTIAKLLLKFQDVANGSITMNGYNLADIQTSYLRQQSGYVPQNIELFSATVLENILMGNETAKYEDVIRATKMSGAYDFIAKLPERFQTKVENQGASFSGGEKQRLAITRAFVKERQLYIFDESTSNLDSFSEQTVQESILRSTKKVTTIVIAHRLSTIVNSDIIIYMEEGKILEQGTHLSLMAQKGRYSEMIQLQYGQQLAPQDAVI